jgi:hypothetical protein
MSKLLLFGVLAVAAWMLFRRKGGGRADASGASSPTPTAQTLDRCPVCGVYVLRGADEPCGRRDCPHRRES